MSGIFFGWRTMWTICAALTVWGTLALNGLADVALGVLYLKNGDFVAGQLAVTPDASSVHWQSPLFGEPMVFDIGGVDYIDYGRKVTNKGKSNPSSDEVGRPPAKAVTRIQTLNGDVLHGELVSLSNEELVIESLRHGRVRIKRSHLIEIDGVSDESARLFHGTGTLNGWSSLSSTDLGTDSWSINGRSIETSKTGANLLAACAEAASVLCEIELSGNDTPEFQIVLGTGNFVNHLSDGFSIETWGPQLVAHRQNGDELNHVELAPVELPRSNWKLRLEVYVDYDQSRMVVYSGGQRVGELLTGGRALPGSGIVIRNRGQHLRIDQMRVRRWSGPPRGQSDDTDLLVRSDGSWATGKIGTLHSQSRQLQFETTQEVQRIPVDEIDQLRFQSPDRSDQQRSPIHQIQVDYQDGVSVQGEYLKTLPDGLWISARFAMEPFRLTWPAMQTVRFAIPTTDLRSTDGRAALVEHETTSIHGYVVKGRATTELSWVPAYSDYSVSFRSQLANRVSFQPASMTDGDDAIRSLLVLVNGDTVPCDVESMNEEHVFVRLSNGEMATVARGHFKAVRNVRSENLIYAGMAIGDRWFVGSQDRKSWSLDADGAMSLYQPVLFGRKFSLPDRCQISFDIQFHQDASLVLGYGADTPAHAVTAASNQGITKEMLEAAAKTKPDGMVEIVLSRKGNRLTASGRSRAGGPLGMLMFRQAGVRRNRRHDLQTLPLDKNAVAHIDFLVDRASREFIVRGNGVEMFRWRDPAPLEGDFVHFGIMRQHPHQVQGKNRPLKSNDSVKLTIFNFHICRWPGQMSEDHRERFLTRRLGASPQSVTHVLRAANGDSLRGQLVRLEKDVAVFRSRLDEIAVPRERIAEIIALRDVSQVMFADENPHLATVRLWGGGTIGLRSIQANDRHLIGESLLVGRISVPWEMVAAIAFNGQLPDDHPFAKWVLIDPLPLPATSQSGASELSPWLDKPAPDFKIRLLDGRQIALADLQGRPVVLDFWATWCGPCLASMPSIMELAKEFEGQAHVIAINQQESAEEIQDFLTARLWEDLTVGLDTQGAIGRLFGVTAIPYTVVIDAEGIVRHVHVGAAPNLRGQLTDVLNMLQDKINVN